MGVHKIDVSKDIELVLNQAIVGVENRDVRSVLDASNRLVHNSTTVQDKYSVRVSVLVYSLGKLLGSTKSEQKHSKKWEGFWEEVVDKLNQLRRCLIQGDHKDFDQELKKLFSYIKKFDSNFEEHVSDVLRKAKVKKAFKIFEHGVSVGRVADLLGVTNWEAMNYIGWSNTFERKDSSKDDALKRYNKVRRVLDS